MQIHELRHFLVLAESLHFGRASQACNVSPSALSRIVRRIEDEVGLPLLVRDRRSVELTPAGERFRSFARGTVEAWDHLRSDVMGGSGELTGELRLFSSVTASYTVLTELFSRFRAAYPGIHIRLETGDAADAVDEVLEGTADVTVAARPDRLPAGLRFRPITETPLCFVAPRAPCEVSRLASAATIDWRAMPMVLSERGLSRKRAEAWFRARGIRPRIYAEVSGHEAILSMVSLGCGVGVVPGLVVERSALRDEVRVLDVSPELEPYVVGLCAHRRRLASPLVRAFWEIAANG
jgi:LysR family transcriptional regulator, positive regulator for ilvC